MTDIRVVITGLVLLTAQELYVGGGEKKIGAALAIAVPAEKDGKYDVEIPAHVTKLTFDDGDIDTVAGTDTARADKIRDQLETELGSDHVMIGQYDPAANPRTCSLFTGTADESAGLRQVPHLKNLKVKTFDLKTKAKPSGNDFSGIDKTLLSAWLDIPNGKLTVKHEKKEELTIAEFRPSRHQQVLARSVVWHRETAAGRRACIVIDPFDDDDAGPNFFDVVVFLKDGKRRVEFKNVADEETGEPHLEAGYDFEMYYNVLESGPDIPAVPYIIGSRKAKGHGHDDEDDDVSGLGGANCGPAGIP